MIAVIDADALLVNECEFGARHVCVINTLDIFPRVAYDIGKLQGWGSVNVGLDISRDMSEYTGRH